MFYMDPAEYARLKQIHEQKQYAITIRKRFEEGDEDYKRETLEKANYYRNSEIYEDIYGHKATDPDSFASMYDAIQKAKNTNGFNVDETKASNLNEYIFIAETKDGAGLGKVDANIKSIREISKETGEVLKEHYQHDKVFYEILAGATVGGAVRGTVEGIISCGGSVPCIAVRAGTRAIEMGGGAGAGKKLIELVGDFFDYISNDSE